MHYSASSVQGPSNVRRTTPEATVARTLRIQLDEEARTALFHDLRINHRLRSSLRGGTRCYDMYEAERAYQQHLQNCQDKECGSGRFATPLSEVMPEKALPPRQQVENYFKEHGEVRGTTHQLASTLKLKETQVRQCITKLVEAGRLESIRGGWRYVPKRENPPKPDPVRPKPTPRPKADPNRLTNREQEIINMVSAGQERDGVFHASYEQAAGLLGIAASNLQNRVSTLRRRGILQTQRVGTSRTLFEWTVHQPPQP